MPPARRADFHPSPRSSTPHRGRDSSFFGVLFISKKAAAAATLFLPGFEPDLPGNAPPVAKVPASVRVIPVAPVTSALLVPPEPAIEAEPEAKPMPCPQGWRLAAAPPRAAPRESFPPLRPADLNGLGGAVAKFEANVRAINVLARIEAENRPPDAEERLAMARYTGWGSLPMAFNLDGKDPGWDTRARRLQALLDEADYVSARASINNSHYTTLEVIDALWVAAKRLGFTGGRVLEPAAGIGHFIGAMPKELMAHCQLTAVEIDRLSGRLLQALYDSAGVAVHIAPFEKSAFPDRWFDLVIGNVPFGNYKVPESSNRPYAGFSIHNYFIARSLDLVRPGGLVILITSSHTLDSHRGTVRQYLASKAHLLGAIRLPRGAFSALAGTDIQTDILILRRREGAEAPEDAWIDLQRAPDALIDPSHRHLYMFINAWYARHPEWLIGRLRMESNGYAKTPTAVYECDLDAALHERIALLPEGIYRPASTVTPTTAPRAKPAAPGARPGTFSIHQGRLHRVEGASMEDVHDRFNATQRARIAGMCAIRDHARALLDAQLAEEGDEKLLPLRAMLNGTYDRYVAEYGYPRQNGLAVALRELGRIERTLFILDWLQSVDLRRRVHAGLNKGEARNALARAVFFNRLGEIRDRSFEQQRYRASGLNLVTAAIVLWNTVYLERAMNALRGHDQGVDDALLQYLSPLGWEHINLTGDYLWRNNAKIGAGKFRPLRPLQPA